MAEPKNNQNSSAFELLEKSKNIVFKNWQVFAVASLPFIVSAVFDSLNRLNANVNTNADSINVNWGLVAGAGIFGLIIFIAQIYFAAATVGLHVRSAKGQKPTYQDIFTDANKYVLRLFVLGILVSVVVIVGFILLIIPGIIAIGRLAMSAYHMVDKNLDPLEAMAESNKQAKGNMGKIYAAIGVLILISIVANLFNYVPLIGGLIYSAIMITFSLVLVLRYKQLKG